MKNTPSREPSALLTMAEAADMLRCCVRMVYLLRDAGKIRLVKQGRSTRITRAEIERYVASLESEAASTAASTDHQSE